MSNMSMFDMFDNMSMSNMFAMSNMSLLQATSISLRENFFKGEIFFCHRKRTSGNTLPW